jgi:hypothetical protein
MFMKTMLARKAALILAALLLTFTMKAAVTNGQDSDHQGAVLKAQLFSLNQVPAVFAKSAGVFEGTLSPDGTLTYSLTYANMSSPVVQAHIHFGASKTNGGVVVFLCGGVIASTTPCPASGTVTGTITAANVSVLPATNSDSVIPQGINPGDFASLVEAIRSGNAYVNVHTANFPSGEIRGQVRVF